MKNKILIGSGLVLIMISIFLAVFNISESNNATKNSKESLEKIEEQIEINKSDEQIEENNPNKKKIIKEKQSTQIDGLEYIGKLEIPSLNLELPVIEEWSYDNFKIAPCRYNGLPESGDLIIAAHNYKNHFGRLKDLNEGDKIIFTDIFGDTFDYEVSYFEKLDGKEVDRMKNGDWDLTLFTCTIGGKSRIVVRCNRIE